MSSDDPIEVRGHPDAVKYLRVQGGVFAFSAVLIGVIMLVILLEGMPVFGTRDYVWLTFAGVLVAALALAASWSWKKQPARLKLANGALEVDGVAVPLDATTTIELVHPEPLTQPLPSRIAMYRLPGFNVFPHFTGGPHVRVRSGSQTVQFQPLLYGPAAFFGTAANPRATELFDHLTSTSPRGEVSPWLRALFLPGDGVPNIVTSATTFVVSYLIINTLILGGIGVMVVRAIHLHPAP